MSLKEALRFGDSGQWVKVSLSRQDQVWAPVRVHAIVFSDDTAQPTPHPPSPPHDPEDRWENLADSSHGVTNVLGSGLNISPLMVDDRWFPLVGLNSPSTAVENRLSAYLLICASLVH